MKIGIIGAGRVGCSIGKYLVVHNSDVTLTGYYSRQLEHAVEAARFTGSEAFSDLSELICASDTLFLTVADDAIETVWDCIAKQNLKGKTICHFSGSLSSDVFSGMEPMQISAGSIHPMYAFSDRFHSYEQLNTVLFTMEGDARFLTKMSHVFETCGNRVCTIVPKDKVRYHAAASFASNHVLGILSMSVSMLTEIGFSQEDAYAVLEPLVMNNVHQAFKTGVEHALTGPIERGDTQTVNKHLIFLTEEEEAVYRAVGMQVLKAAKKKNTNQNYQEIERILIK